MNCPICGSVAILMHGCMWDVDRMMCGRHGCEWEQELLVSTCEDGHVVNLSEK